jgi:hypothetical protein
VTGLLREAVHRPMLVRFLAVHGYAHLPSLYTSLDGATATWTGSLALRTGPCPAASLRESQLPKKWGFVEMGPDATIVTVGLQVNGR